MMNVLPIGLRMMPIAGPFLAIAFPLAWKLIVDPDSAYGLLRDLAPAIDLTDRLIRPILDSMDETKEYLPNGWETLALPAQPSSGAQKTSPREKYVPESVPELDDIGKSLAFIMAEQTLARSGHDPIENEPPDRDDRSEVELVSPPTEFPDEKGEPGTF